MLAAGVQAALPRLLPERRVSPEKQPEQLQAQLLTSHTSPPAQEPVRPPSPITPSPLLTLPVPHHTRACLCEPGPREGFRPLERTPSVV